MKKTLIALAAVAASTGAMAQATISGVLDISAVSNTKVQTTTGATTTTVKTDTTSDNAGRWATSELRFAGTEDLGGGLRASFQLNSDLRNTPAFVSRDRWVQLSGGFGSLRLGSQGNVGNSAGFNAYTQTGTTGVGSTYGLGINPAAVAAETIERQNNVINYTSPSFNGVTVMVGTARNSVDSDAAALQGKAETTQNGLSVTYAAGPLSAGFGISKRTIKTELGTAAAAAAAEIKVDGDFIGASYNLGVATVGAAIINNDRKTGGVTDRNQKLNVVGVTVPMGAFTLRASTYNGKNSGAAVATDNIKLSGHQISVTYALSKRTTAYAYMGENKTKRDGAASTATVAKTTGTHVGIAHSF